MPATDDRARLVHSLSVDGSPVGDLQAQLAVLERAAEVAREAASLEEAAQVVLDEVCGLMDWPVAHLLIVGPDGALEPTPLWHVSDPVRFRVLRQVGQASAGPGLDPVAGQPDRAGRPAVTEMRDLPEAATRAGLCRSFDFVVASPDRAVAVLRFFSETAVGPPPARLRVVSTAVEQLGRVADRVWAAAAEEARGQALDASHDAFVELDLNGVVLDWSRRAEALFGWSRPEAVGRSLGELVIPLRFRMAHERGLRQLRGRGGEPRPARRELTAMSRSGSELPVELTVWATRRQGRKVIAGFVRDLSERRSFEGQLARVALHDRLTGLPNRILLRDRIEHALARAAASGPARPSIALLLVDLDRFRSVNDELGHDGGDELLAVVAERLEGLAGPADTLARIGGDQFALLREESAASPGTEALAAEVLARLAEPVTSGGVEVVVTASVGVALASGTGDLADLLVRDAELALERAKRRGGGRFEVFDEAVRVQASERLALESDLRAAIRHGQLRVVYQPIVTIESGEIAGFEALVRWHHPDRGTLPPSEFIPSAESTGLIVPLGKFVLGEACRQAAAWQRERLAARPLRVSVNVSARQLAQPGWVGDVAEALDQSGIDPDQLVLEITESALMEQMDSVVPQLESLRRAGVRIAIDDFGTGYSSLGYLRSLPVDVLKIDKSFIDGVAEGPHESALARAVIKLAANLGLDAVAEGVSNRRQLAQLRRLHCPYGQGFLFARPQPAEAFSDLLGRPTLTVDSPAGA